MAKIKVGLSSSSIQEAIDKLNNLKKGISNLENEIPRELADMTAKKITQYYSQKGFSSDDTPVIGVDKTDKGYKAYITGRSVIYDEFGTGENGKDNPHPEKDKYPLNDYNSGPVVSTHINENGRHYWYYKGYTEGNRAGLFMYNSSIWLRDNYKKIIKKKVDDMLSKL